MSETKRIFMAAMYGLTNMGMAVPDKRLLRQVREGVSDGKLTFKNAVEHFSAEYCENDDHRRMFIGEAEAWYDRKNLLDNLQPRDIKAWNDSFPKRWETALQINEGAVNIIPIATAIADAAREVNDEYRGSNHEDPAVRLMAHQLAHLTQVGAVMDMQDYQSCVDKCTEEAEVVRALRDAD